VGYKSVALDGRGQTFANSNTYGTGYNRATAYPVGTCVRVNRKSDSLTLDDEITAVRSGVWAIRYVTGWRRLQASSSAGWSATRVEAVKPGGDSLERSMPKLRRISLSFVLVREVFGAYPSKCGISEF
jgi:hypothetical protein